LTGFTGSPGYYFQHFPDESAETQSAAGGTEIGAAIISTDAGQLDFSLNTTVEIQIILFILSSKKLENRIHS
jgi:hypothetical protein